jgi:metallo-beta-lactamase class B
MDVTKRLMTLAEACLAAAVLLSTDVTGQGGGRQGGAAAPQNETLSQTYRGSRANDVEYQKIAPFKIFDNLYHVGPGMVSVWMITTTDGLILIDSSWEPYVDHVINNIRKLGFDPKNIRYILVTQSHIDHFGGAARIQELSGARVATTEEDWQLMAEYEKKPTPNFPVQRVPKRDLVLNDGDTVRLGTTSLKVYKTPGHTPGIPSFEFTVYDGGRPHKAFLFGGPEPVATLGVKGAEQFLASVNRIAKIPDVQVGFLVHSWLAVSTYPNGGTFERAQKLAPRKPAEPHPFVDPASWRAWMTHLNGVATKFLQDQQQKAAAAPAGASR